MSGPSDPVLSWLRRLIKDRGLNTAELARLAELPRPRLRKVLGGGERMLVDELIAISNALELSPADMGMPQLEGLDPDAELPEEPPTTGADPYGSHAAQLIRMGFDLGCDFLFQAAISQLGDSGVPPSVLAANRDRLVIKLDAAYHQYNAPRYHDDGVTLTLSFSSGLTDCTFPWDALDAVTFSPEPAVQPASEEDDDDDPTPSERPRLRLVT